MDVDSGTYLAWAAAIGALSAVSLPLGSLVGLAATFRPATLALLAAFGAGALIAALSVELVAPTVAALEHTAGQPDHAAAVASFAALVAGAVAGGLLFVALDQIVNAQGGFLRKTASTMAYFRLRRRTRVEALIREACEIPFLSEVPPEDVHRLAEMLRPVTFTRGEALFEEGDPADALLYLRSGPVRVLRDGRAVAEAPLGSLLGALAVATNSPYPGTALADGTVSCWAISRERYEELRQISPAFDRAVRGAASENLAILKKHHAEETSRAQDWAEEALHALKTGAAPPSSLDLRRARKEHGGAPLAVWLGILLDGIPESLVIGFGFLALLGGKLAGGGDVGFGEVVPYTLVAALFLSNFPEALSSSANMRLQGWGRGTIFGLWLSLMVITAAGAGLGYLVGGSIPHTWLTLSEGLAAGAMLTMIASTMIPEAVHSGSPPLVGLGTLAGFLSAVAFKLFE